METARQPDTDAYTSAESPEDYPPTVLTDVPNADTMGLYLRDVSKTPLLEGKEEEAELSQRIEAGLYAAHLLMTKKGIRKQRREELEWIAEDGTEAKDQFITANLRLVIKFSKKYRHLDVPQTDIIQHGNLGLIRAVEKFDYKKGYKFSTYATWWIRQSIDRELLKTSRLIYLPAEIDHGINKIAQAERSLENQGIATTVEILAKETKMDAGRIQELLLWRKSHSSLEAPIGHDGDGTLADMIADTPTAKLHELSPEDTSQLEKLNAVMQEVLSDREYLALGHLYGIIDGSVLKYKEISKILGISDERVRQIVRDAFRKTLAKVYESAPEPDTLA